MDSQSTKVPAATDETKGGGFRGDGNRKQRLSSSSRRGSRGRRRRRRGGRRRNRRSRKARIQLIESWGFDEGRRVAMMVILMLWTLVRRRGNWVILYQNLRMENGTVGVGEERW